MNIGGVAKMQQKYEPHIRVKFSLFDDPQFRTIPKRHRAYAYLVFICLLKFANSKTLTCYPRQATLCNMTGLSRTTVYRITELLEAAKIISKKRLQSTTLYYINKNYVVSTKNMAVSNRNIRSVYGKDINKTNIKEPSLLTNFIGSLASDGSDNKTILNAIANKYTIQELNKFINDEDNPYLCKKALEIKEDQNKTYIDIDLRMVDKVRKNTNYFYKNKVFENKRKHGRQAKTKSFLSESNKKK